MLLSGKGAEKNSYILAAELPIKWLREQGGGFRMDDEKILREEIQAGSGP